mmetsp:Transcript_34592/g.73870  ORF Transcript_34592/g.73870 Transcript_34592/m.73870 type:complete len:110 (-) Transcript_34592:86-415(-)
MGMATYTLAQVAAHCTKDDAWIVVHDKVYDLTPHLKNHEGWVNVGKVSTLLALLSSMGQDCTDDFVEVHSPTAWKMLAAFQIGTLAEPNTGPRRIKYRTWEEMQQEGVV